VALSPWANYTDWRPPLVDEIWCQLLWIAVFLTGGKNGNGAWKLKIMLLISKYTAMIFYSGRLVFPV
jgi:hypothetical protein